MIKRVLIAFLRLAVRVLRSILGDRRILVLWDKVIGGAQSSTSSFVTYHVRPKLAASVRTSSHPTNKLPSLAIVVQGPIVHKDEFTLESAKVYRQHFGSAKLILSTWDDEPASALKNFEELGIDVIQNRKPSYPGVSNINMQILSTQNGMRLAKEHGAEYVLKTRTDQRIFAPNVAVFLNNIIEMFPVRGVWSKQRKRIVGCSLNTFKYRMYGLSDMLVYGHIDDQLMYWNAEFDNRAIDMRQQIEGTSSLRSFARNRVCEVYLATEFLTKIGRNLRWSLRDSWETFVDHFCVVDKEQLDLYWCKYNHLEYRWLGYGYDMRMQELSFREWLNLYASMQSIEVPEDLLDAPYSRLSG